MNVQKGLVFEMSIIVYFNTYVSLQWLGSFRLSTVAYLDSELRGRAIFICILYHHLTNNTRDLRSLTHNIIRVIQLIKNYGYIHLFKHRPMRKTVIRKF